ncbi:MAG: DUF3617 domain-containing protein [Acidobacteriota bacterium]
MKISSAMLAGACVGILCVSSAHAGSTLNVKLGLWEMTTMGQVSGPPPIPPEALARLTPQQRARFQASIAERMAQQNKAEVHQYCVTQKDLERGLDLKDAQTEGCKTTVISNSSSVMEMRQTCSGRHKVNGTIRIEAPNPETVVGKFNMVMSEGPNTMTMKFAMHGHWLGADCGNVKSDD